MMARGIAALHARKNAALRARRNAGLRAGGGAALRAGGFAALRAGGFVALRAGAVALGLLAFAALPAQADDALCPVPDGLTFGGFSLPQSQAQLSDGKRLVVMMLGGASFTGMAAGGRTYALPARLEVRLRNLLPGKDIAVVPRVVDGGSTHAAVDEMAAGIHGTGAKLVVWETGSGAAAGGSDLEMFNTNLEAGINTAKEGKSDIILIDLQYAPSIARVMNLAPYSDAIRMQAEMAAIPVFPRSALMHAWSDSGELDFDTDSAPERLKVARKLYDCLAAGLANGIAEALR
jgi:hypothetical protein